MLGQRPRFGRSPPGGTSPSMPGGDHRKPVTAPKGAMGLTIKTGAKARERTRRAIAKGLVTPKPSQSAVKRGNNFLAPERDND